MVRGYLQVALENIPLWHERDISHSSAERIIFPDSFGLIDFMLTDMTRIIRGLRVYPEQMLANIAKTRGLIFSQRLLLVLIEKGLGRFEAYKIVQALSMKVWSHNEMDLQTYHLPQLHRVDDDEVARKRREEEKLYRFRSFDSGFRLILKE